MVLTCLGLAVAMVQSPQEKDLAAAARLWKTMGMPTLSTTSVPVLVPLGWWAANGAPEAVGLGFTHPSSVDGDGLIVGTRIVRKGSGERDSLGFETGWASAYDGAMPADWTQATTERLSSGTFGPGLGFRIDTTLCSAVACEASGRHDFALRLFKKVNLTTDQPGFTDMYLGYPVTASLEATTAREIEIELVNELVEPSTDRRAILTKLKLLASKKLLGPLKDRRLTNKQLAEEGLTSQPIWPGIRAVIKDLQTTVDAPSEPLGSIAAAVADLTNACGELSAPSPYSSISLGQTGEYSPDSRFEELRKMGLKAVPDLVEHPGDASLTRCFLQGMNMGGSGIISVGMVVESLLEEISGGEIVGPTREITKDQARAWYKAKLAGTIDEYLLSNVDDFAGEPHRKEHRASDRTFDYLSEHRPDLLPEAYRRILQTGVVWIYPADYAIYKSSLSRDAKVALFLEGATASHLDNRPDPLEYLVKYDKEAFRRILLESVNSLATDAAETDVTWEAAGSDDPTIWAAAEAAIERGNPAVKRRIFEAISGNSVRGFDDRTLRSLELLARYFDDRAVGHAAIEQATMLTVGKWEAPKNSASWEAAKESLIQQIRARRKLPSTPK